MEITSSRYKIVKDPVHGYIKLYSHEIPLIDTYPFQRLRRLKQLAVADLVYPGAVHTRFEHSLGVAHVAEVMVREALSKAGIGKDEIERYAFIVRLIALLHDIGHGPYSHVFEDYILYPRRINHEIMGSKIVREHNEIASPLEKLCAELGISLEDLAKAISATSVHEWPFTNTLKDFDERALFYIIKGPFSADIVDYLLRDSYYTGASYGSGLDWVRIARFTYVYGDKLVLDERAQEVMDQLIMARLFMFSTVYYHKKVRAATKFVGDILKEIDRLKLIDFDECIKDAYKYVDLDDYNIMLNPSVRTLPLVRDFLSRRIPYKAIAEKRFSLNEPLEAIMGHAKNYMESIIEDRLRSLGISLERGRDFFVDTPRLPLNPMLSGDILFIKSIDGGIIERSVLELSWFHIPKTVVVTRLFVHRNVMKYADILRKLFFEIHGGREFRSFY